MKIVGIIASPRGRESNTLKLVNGVLKGAREEGALTELIDLYSLNIEYCRACGNCYAKGDCTLYDDFPDLFDTLMDADGIVLGAPNYIDSIPAPLKAVFDRMADAIHCQMFYGKFGCSFCTAGGSNHDPVVEYMNHALSSLGTITVGGVGVAMSDGEEGLNAGVRESVELGRKLVRSIRGEFQYPGQEEALLQRRDYFRQLVLWNKDTWTHEYDWYLQMGWITPEK
ncbi:MAG: flavodoxin family protein [Methanoregulaceae archaeon]|jgi:multimeric flavodoxin WrbA|nr:flavodoxin family protein [Methanoregulaceae archaeon]